VESMPRFRTTKNSGTIARNTGNIIPAANR
jgi:hypothetical protein